MSYVDPQPFEAALASVGARATRLDISGDWPAEDLADLAAFGAMRWAVANEFGGDGITPLELHLRYEALAAASVATALVLTQRDSAAGLIAGCEESRIRQTLLPKLAANELFATIGIAQLTTSRQGGAPALVASRTTDGYRLDGFIPWSTGPARSDFVVAGAVVDDASGQILVALPTGAPGVRVRPPVPLVALRSSWTTSVDCDGVAVSADLVLCGPVPNVLDGRKKGIVVSQVFLGLGLCRSALELIATHDSDRGRETYERFEGQLSELRGKVLDVSQPGRETDAAAAAPSLRGACNDLALRATHSAVALFKGSSLRTDHPAQRLAREALFLLVWSCPDPVIECTVNLLTGAGKP